MHATSSPLRRTVFGLISLVTAPALSAAQAPESGGLVEYRRQDLRASVGGWVVLDAVKYGHANHRRSGLELDSADLIIDLGLSESLRVHVRPDLIGVDTPRHLREAWIGLPVASATLRVGLLPMGLSRERVIRPEDREILGHAFPESLEGRTDVGVTIQGVAPLSWMKFGAELGIGEGFGLEGHRRDSPRGALHGRVRPWSQASGALLHALWLGGGLAWQGKFDDPLRVTTPTESVVFATPDLNGDAGFWTHWALGWESGPVSVKLERLEGEAEDVPIPGGGTQDFDQLTAYTASAVVRIGVPWLDDAERGDEAEGRRLLLGVRYSNADIDRGLFDTGITTYDPSTQEVRTFTASAGLTDTGPLRVSLNYVRTIADHELSTFGGTNRDSTFVLRVGARF